MSEPISSPLGGRGSTALQTAVSCLAWKKSAQSVNCALREELGAEKECRERAEREREELRRELEEVRPRGWPWWVVGLLVIVVLTTLVVLSLRAILSTP
jgi:hypothetical protein